MLTYFHGGVPGLRPGDLLLPPDESGTNRTLSQHAEAVGAPAWATRRDVIYVTTERADARVFAAFYPDGALYRVEPEGPLGDDPDAPGISHTCRTARIAAVLDPVVLFRSRSPEAWLRQLDRHNTTRSS